jgi:8-oxo-dGTP diphosphatase
MQTIVVVAAIIVDSEGRYLACRRAPDKVSGGKWEFPGGKLDHGETEPEALLREIREELAIEVRVLRLFDRSATETEIKGQSVVIELACYVCDLVGDGPVASTDHDELRWVAENQMSKLDWAEPDLPAVKKILVPTCS